MKIRREWVILGPSSSKAKGEEGSFFSNLGSCLGLQLPEFLALCRRGILGFKVQAIGSLLGTVDGEVWL